MLDRRNFLGLAATATVATAIGLSMGPTLTREHIDVASPELETDADAGLSPRRPRLRSMRQSAVAPGGGAGATGTGVHPRRAARGQLGPTSETEVTIAHADVTATPGRGARGARAALP